MRLLWVDGATWYHTQLTVPSFVMSISWGCGYGSFVMVNRLHGHQKLCDCEVSKCGGKVPPRRICSGRKNVFAQWVKENLSRQKNLGQNLWWPARRHEQQ